MNTTLRSAALFGLGGLAAGFAGGLYLGRDWRIPLPTRQDRFSLAIYSGPDPLNLRPLYGCPLPAITVDDVTDTTAEFVADPFLIQKDGTWCLFFEVLSARSGRGEIAYATSQDLRTWTYGSLVLCEPFHLSYPQVFEWLGETFMVPESMEAQSVRLYRAEAFPHGWVLDRTLLYGSFVDASLVHFHGYWWMFAGSGEDMLRLFYAADLRGPWMEHPRSPLLVDRPDLARPGGRVIPYQGQLLRFGQNQAEYYGQSISAVMVDEITPTIYREHVLDGPPVVSNTGAGWNARGMHHVDPHQLPDGTWVASVDGAARAWVIGRRGRGLTPRQVVRGVVSR